MCKLRKSLLMVGVLLLSSLAFSGCSDVDNKMPDNTLGACYVLAITAGTDYVDLHWNITPTSNVEGYKVQIYEGTYGNLGGEITSGTFSKKTYESRFNGLKPNTHYVVVSQCIPASGSKFTKADVAYYEFWTAPTLTPTSVNAVVTESASAETGYKATITVTWQEVLDIQQVNRIYIYLENSKEEQLAYFTTPYITGSLGTSYTFDVDNVEPGDECLIELLPDPSEYSFYTTATVAWGDLYFTMPQAQ